MNAAIRAGGVSYDTEARSLRVWFLAAASRAGYRVALDAVVRESLNDRFVPESVSLALRAETKALRQVCWDAMMAIGATGANGDVSHPLRATWEALRAAAEGR